MLKSGHNHHSRERLYILQGRTAEWLGTDSHAAVAVVKFGPQSHSAKHDKTKPGLIVRNITKQNKTKPTTTATNKLNKTVVWGGFQFFVFLP